MGLRLNSVSLCAISLFHNILEMRPEYVRLVARTVPIEHRLTAGTGQYGRYCTPQMGHNDCLDRKPRF
jgi:hypothetical protein